MATSGDWASGSPVDNMRLSALVVQASRSHPGLKSAVVTDTRRREGDALVDSLLAASAEKFGVTADALDIGTFGGDAGTFGGGSSAGGSGARSGAATRTEHGGLVDITNVTNGQPKRRREEAAEAEAKQPRRGPEARNAVDLPFDTDDEAVVAMQSESEDEDEDEDEVWAESEDEAAAAVPAAGPGAGDASGSAGGRFRSIVKYAQHMLQQLQGGWGMPDGLHAMPLAQGHAYGVGSVGSPYGSHPGVRGQPGGPFVPSSGDPSAGQMGGVEAELLGGTAGRAGHSGRCAVCVIKRKGKCGTESAPIKCLRRSGSVDDDDVSDQMGGVEAGCGGGGGDAGGGSNPSADLTLSKIAQNGSREVEAELLGGTTGRAGHSGRCAVCVIQRKGKCGTESAPKKCLRRSGSVDEDDVSDQMGGVEAGCGGGGGDAGGVVSAPTACSIGRRCAVRHG